MEPPIRSPSPSGPVEPSLLVRATDPCRGCGSRRKPGRVPHSSERRTSGSRRVDFVVGASFDDAFVDTGQRQPANSIRPVGPAPAIATAWASSSRFCRLQPLRIQHVLRPFRVFISHSAILQHDPGVAASPPVRGIVRVARSSAPCLTLNASRRAQPGRRSERCSAAQVTGSPGDTGPNPWRPRDNVQVSARQFGVAAAASGLM